MGEAENKKCLVDEKVEGYDEVEGYEEVDTLYLYLKRNLPKLSI